MGRYGRILQTWVKRFVESNANVRIVLFSTNVFRHFTELRRRSANYQYKRFERLRRYEYIQNARIFVAWNAAKWSETSPNVFSQFSKRLRNRRPFRGPTRRTYKAFSNRSLITIRDTTCCKILGRFAWRRKSRVRNFAYHSRFFRNSSLRRVTMAESREQNTYVRGFW